MSTVCGSTWKLPWRRGMLWQFLMIPFSNNVQTSIYISASLGCTWGKGQMHFGANELGSVSFALPYFLPYLTSLSVHKLSRSNIPIFRKDRKLAEWDFEYLLSTIRYMLIEFNKRWDILLFQLSLAAQQTK